MRQCGPGVPRRTRTFAPDRGPVNIPHLRFAAVLAAAYLVALAVIAFWPTPVDRSIAPGLAGALRWLHAHGLPASVGYNQVEFGANIALFFPLGYISGALARRAWWHPLVAGFAASCLIEVGQGLLLPDRFPSLQDIVANTLGTGFGAAVFALLHTLHLRRECRMDAAAGNPAPAEPLQVRGATASGGRAQS